MKIPNGIYCSNHYWISVCAQIFLNSQIHPFEKTYIKANIFQQGVTLAKDKEKKITSATVFYKHLKDCIVSLFNFPFSSQVL